MKILVIFLELLIGTAKGTCPIIRSQKLASPIFVKLSLNTDISRYFCKQKGLIYEKKNNNHTIYYLLLILHTTKKPCGRRSLYNKTENLIIHLV